MKFQHPTGVRRPRKVWEGLELSDMGVMHSYRVVMGPGYVVCEREDNGIWVRETNAKIVASCLVSTIIELDYHLRQEG